MEKSKKPVTQKGSGEVNLMPALAAMTAAEAGVEVKSEGENLMPALEAMTMAGAFGVPQRGEDPDD